MLAPVQMLMRGSTDPEHRYAAAIPDALVELPTGEVIALLESGSGTALLAWHRLRICLRLAHGSCPEEERFAEDLPVVDSDNSEARAQVAASRYRRDEQPGLVMVGKPVARGLRPAGLCGDTKHVRGAGNCPQRGRGLSRLR